MLNLVDKLRSIEKIRNAIPLPQIVVVGQQSSGKSSVLNAISGLEFPVGSGVCTQFPTEIILRRDDVVRTKASIRHASEIDDDRRLKIQKFETKWQHADLSKLQTIITEVKEVLHFDENSRFSSDSLVLNISGPDQEHLTLIDLPGFFISTKTDQTEEDIGLVNRIADRYASNSRAVVLAVISGKNDFQNQLILQSLNDNVDFRNRTLGVITAPDLVDPESEQEAECIQYIQDDPRGLGYGWHVLRNLNYEEVRDGVVDRDAREKEFFQKKHPWNRFNSTAVGVETLKTRLSSILKKKIAESLPEIQREVDERLKQIHVELNALGESRQSPDDFKTYLTKCADSFKSEVDAMLQGLPPVPMNGLIHQFPSLRARVQSLHESFAIDMFDKAQTWKLHPQGKDGIGLLYKILEDEYDTKEVAIVPPQTMTSWLSEQMHKHRGKHQTNLVHLDWATAIFQLKAQRWKHIAEAHCKVIFDEVTSYLSDSVYGLIEDAVADRLWNEIMEPALAQRRDALQKKLEELYYPYTLSSIYCVSRGYDRSLEKPVFGEDTYAFAQCSNMLKSAEAFYNVAVDVFTDNVITLGVECCLLDGLSDILNARLFYEMSVEKLEYFGGEENETRECRDRLLKEKAQFEEARDRILPALGRLPPSRLRSQRNKTAIRVTQPELGPVTSDPTQTTAVSLPITPKAASGRTTMPTPAANSTTSTTSSTPAVKTSLDSTPSSSIVDTSTPHRSKATSSISSSGGYRTQDAAKSDRGLSRSVSPRQNAPNSSPSVFDFAAPKFSFSSPPRNEDDLRSKRS